MSPFDVLYVCVAAALLPAIFSKKTAMSRHQQELKEHYEHLAKIADFQCDLPQPRLLNLHELLSDFQMRGKAYFPEVTVLHRCDRHVGSCNSGNHHCGPTLASEVKMPFKVTFLEAMGDHSKGEWEMEYHSLENHTTCGCIKYEGDPPSKTKTAVHYHYIDPSLIPPQTFLPLDPASQDTRGNASSYDVPLYQFNSTQEQLPRNESDQGSYSGPSIYDMTKLAEEEVKPSLNEETPNPKPEDEIPCLSCGESQNSGLSGHSPSSESSTDSTRDSWSTSNSPSHIDNNDDKADAEATTIPSEFLRFGNGDSPQAGALTDTQESPYDSYLRQAF